MLTIAFDNKLSDILQGIGAKLFSKNKTAEDLFNKVVKAHNPISREIRGNQFHTGTNVFSTLNLVMRGLAVVVGIKANVEISMVVYQTQYIFFW